MNQQNGIRELVNNETNFGHQNGEDCKSVTEMDRMEQQIDQSNESTPTTYTSQLAAFLVILNVTVGVGLLAMPAAIQTAGLITSMIVQVIFVSFIIVTCIMCSELTYKTTGKVNSYHKLVQAHCHEYVYQLTQVSILLKIFMLAIAYIVVIGDQADRTFASIYGHDFCFNWYMNRAFIMSITTLFLIIPMSSSRTVDVLKYTR